MPQCLRPVFTLSIVLALVCIASTIEAKSDPLKSIRPLQTVTTNSETGVESLDAICTTWATVLDHQFVWVTAAHCIKLKETMPDPKENYFIDGHPARLRYVNFDSDIAVLMGGPSVTPLVISLLPPKAGQRVWSAGYPADEGQVRTTGIIMSLYSQTTHYTMYELPAAGGVSGAPVLSEDNTVVGIEQRMACSLFVGYCPVSVGVPFEQMQRALENEGAK